MVFIGSRFLEFAATSILSQSIIFCNISFVLYAGAGNMIPSIFLLTLAGSIKGRRNGHCIYINLHINHSMQKKCSVI